MILAELQLARLAHHAVRFDAANARELQRHVEAGDVRAGRAEYADQAGACVGGAANDLERTVTGIDRLAMLKYGMDDLRPFFDGDIRWLKHYGFSSLDVPTLSGGVGA